MGWFTKDKDTKKDPSGSKGKPNRGFLKGSATTNPDKYKARTEAQADREQRKIDKFK
jgi:hypothetical protein